MIHQQQAMNHPPAPRLKVGIIGAGIAGPVLALQILSHPILRNRFRPIIYDQSRDPKALSLSAPDEWPRTAGAAVGVSPNGLYPLYQLGLRAAIEDASREIDARVLLECPAG